MTTPHNHAEVIKAWADGKVIQYYVQDNNGHWDDFDTNNVPSFNNDRYQWRIKPETKTLWLAISKHGIPWTSSESKADAVQGLKNRTAGYVDIDAVFQITYTEGEGL